MLHTCTVTDNNPLPHTRRAPDSTAYGMMIILCIIWGSQQVVIKLMAPYMAPVVQIAMRSLIVCCLLGGYLITRRQGGLPRNTWLPGTVVGLFFATEFISIAEGLRLTSASHMVVFLYTAPLFTSIGLHFLVAQERMRLLQWVGMATAIAGIALAFLGPDTQQGASTLAGDLLALLAGATWGVTTVVIRHSTLSTLSAQGNMFYQMLFVGVLSLAFAVFSGQPLTAEWNQDSILLMLYQIFVLALCSYLGWFWLLRVYLATRIATLSLLTPLFGVLFGVLILDEPLTVSFIAGAVLVMLGVGLVRLGE